jgi:hypothetical protein
MKITKKNIIFEEQAQAYCIIQHKHDGSEALSCPAQNNASNVADVANLVMSQAKLPQNEGGVLVEYDVEDSRNDAHDPSQFAVRIRETHDGQTYVLCEHESRRLRPFAGSVLDDSAVWVVSTVAAGMVLGH